ncbi:gamma-glutamyltransferase [Pleionea sediminis]|uniref:gamma-glutamyltransferase n=1 Tax=Pleionea sediminis TaxID=2569479 RepID=UPI001FEC0141|nr:gamma-glutamyltransferase [Pleionea sediminis]
MKQYSVLVLITAIFSLAWADNNNDALIEWNSIHRPVKSDGGMVASQEHRASQIAAEILAQGGNAVDAAVALGFAKAVSLPKAGNLGGGGFMLVHLAKENKTIAIDYREMAPNAATDDMFLNLFGQVSLTESRFSLKSSGVPGTVAGLLHALEKYGTMSREQVMQPAINLAEKGIIADNPFLDSLNARKIRLVQDDEVSRIYFKEDAESYRVGEVMRFPDLAKTLNLIKMQGAAGFYEGDVADKFESYMKDNDGLITKKDLKNYKVVEREVIKGSYRGFDVVSMPPPSSGGIHIIQGLNILENFNLSEMGWGSADHIHVMAETFKYMYADRSKHLGDPDFFTVPTKKLIDKKYAKSIAQKISLSKATPSDKISPNQFDDKESRQTTHFSVIDRWGNVVSNTYTLNFSFGSGKIVPGTGVFLNNEMDDFSAKPGVANAYGLIGGEANAIEPKKRPLSSMTPTIIFKNGYPILVTGSPGGSRIITTVMHQIINTIDFKMNVSESAHRPRFHHQWFPDTLFMETGFSPDTIKSLKQRGQNIQESRAGGSVQSISKLNEKEVYGASDPRRSGAKSIGVSQSGQLIYY